MRLFTGGWACPRGTRTAPSVRKVRLWSFWSIRRLQTRQFVCHLAGHKRDRTRVAHIIVNKRLSLHRTRWLTSALDTDIIHMDNVAMEATTIVNKPKTASWTGPLVEGRDFLEQPIVAASAIDRFVENQPGTQKL